MASYRGLTIQSGVYKQIQDADTLRVGGGIDSNTALSINAGTGLNILANSLFDPTQGIDRSSAAALYIGATNATTLYLSRSGQLSQIEGNLSIQGTVNTDVNFIREVNRTIRVNDSTTVDANGGNLTIRSGGGDGTGNGGLLSIIAGDSSGTGTGGSVSIDAGDSASGNPGIVEIGGNTALGINIGRSFITTNIIGGLNQSSGSFTLNGNGASSVKTTTGILTVDGAGGVELKSNGTTTIIFNAAGTTATLQSGVTLVTTGSGNIDLPNNTSAKFKIEGVSVSGTVTAANLDTLTNGSNADALHTHASGSSISITKTAGEALTAGSLLCLQDDSGTPKAYQADADGTGQRPFPVGFTVAAVSSGDPTTIVVAGECLIDDNAWDGGYPAAADVGKNVYMSTAAGKVTLTAPNTSGNTVQKVGIVSSGGSGTSRVLVQIGDGVVLA